MNFVNRGPVILRKYHCERSYFYEASMTEYYCSRERLMNPDLAALFQHDCEKE